MSILAFALAFACALFPTTAAVAITGATRVEALSPSVVAVGTLPVTCGAAFATQCSGVAVAPRLVLTAAHCLPGLRASGRPQVLARGSPEGEPEIVPVTAVAPHPSYTRDGGGLDLAVLTLARSITVPSARVAARSLDAALVGAFATIQGFGVAEIGRSTNTVAAAGQVVITSLADQFVGLAPSPSMVCDGDSGGALFLLTAQGPELAGIITQGDPSCRQWGTAVRLDTGARDFVDRALAGAPALSEDRPPEDPARYGTLCAKECEADLDCPEGTTCLSFGGPRRCLPAGLLPGTLSGSCNQNAACDACVQIQGRQSQCGCYRFCPPDPIEPNAEGCSVVRPSPTGDGAIGGAALGGAIALLSVSRARRRRAHLLSGKRGLRRRR